MVISRSNYLCKFIISIGGNTMKRNELKVLRVRNGLTQPVIAEKLGVSLSTYNLIEQGKRRGSAEFWLKLQSEFNLTHSEVWKLQNPQI